MGTLNLELKGYQVTQIFMYK